MIGTMEQQPFLHWRTLLVSVEQGGGLRLYISIRLEDAYAGTSFCSHVLLEGGTSLQHHGWRKTPSTSDQTPGTNNDRGDLFPHLASLHLSTRTTTATPSPSLTCKARNHNSHIRSFKQQVTMADTTANEAFIKATEESKKLLAKPTNDELLILYGARLPPSLIALSRQSHAANKSPALF